MSTRFSIVALVLAVVAIGVATLDRPEVRAEPDVSNAQFVALEGEVATLARAVEEMNARLAEPPGRGRTSRGGNAAGEPGDAEPASGSGEKLEAIVDAAVEKKTQEVVDELETRADKEPSMDVFASALELTEEQRRAAESDVLRAQREIVTVLETPTSDARDFMDELVEVFAKRMAEPDKDPGWNMWLLRLATQKVPGSDETYAQRVEAAKASLRASFRRDWSKEQYAGFEAWKMDPTEIEEIRGSPYEEIERRILDRARQLGAEIAGDEEE